MTASNKPKNQNPNGLHDLGQIATGQISECVEGWKQNGFKPLPYAVIRNPGTDYENLVGNFSTHRAAVAYIERHFTDDDCHLVDIMKWTDNLELTTEF